MSPLISKRAEKIIYLLVAVFIAILLMISSASAQDVHTYIPEKAYQYLPTLKKESDRIMPSFDQDPYFGALIEHESCIGLKHSKCWSPTSELKTSRELGIGLPQITKAYAKDGSLRFDKLTEMRNAYADELKELSWLNVKERPDLQLRVVVLLTKENWDKFFTVKAKRERLSMADSAYNGGVGGVNQARRICGMKKGCDPQVWEDNVASVLPKSDAPMPGYGGRSPKSINLHHVDDTVNIRYAKYKKYLEEN